MSDYASLIRPTRFDSSVRTRAGIREGAMTPVKKGHYYKATMYSGNSRFVTVYWLPIIP